MMFRCSLICDSFTRYSYASYFHSFNLFCHRHHWWCQRKWKLCLLFSFVERVKKRSVLKIKIAGEKIRGKKALNLLKKCITHIINIIKSETMKERKKKKTRTPTTTQFNGMFANIWKSSLALAQTFTTATTLNNKESRERWKMNLSFFYDLYSVLKYDSFESLQIHFRMCCIFNLSTVLPLCVDSTFWAFHLSGNVFLAVCTDFLFHL